MAKLRTFALNGYSWPSGGYRTAAVLGVPREEIERRHGVQFERGADAVDHYRALGLVLPSSRRAVLFRYDRAPNQPGLTVMIDVADEPTAACGEVLSILGFELADVVWLPDMPPVVIRQVTHRELWGRTLLFCGPTLIFAIVFTLLTVRYARSGGWVDRVLVTGLAVILWFRVWHLYRQFQAARP